MSQLNVSIPPELEPYISRALDAGGFESAEELVVEAIRRMEQMEIPAERLSLLQSKIEEGYAQALRGEFVDPARVRERISRRSARKRSMQ